MRISKNLKEQLQKARTSGEGLLYLVGTDENGVFSHKVLLERDGGCAAWPRVYSSEIVSALDSLRRKGCEQICFLHVVSQQEVNSKEHVKSGVYLSTGFISYKTYYERYAVGHLPLGEPLIILWKDSITSIKGIGEIHRDMELTSYSTEEVTIDES